MHQNLSKLTLDAVHIVITQIQVPNYRIIALNNRNNQILRYSDIFGKTWRNDRIFSSSTHKCSNSGHHDCTQVLKTTSTTKYLHKAVARQYFTNFDDGHLSRLLKMPEIKSLQSITVRLSKIWLITFDYLYKIKSFFF